MADYEHNLKPELLEAKLNYISLRWGVDQASLDSMIQTDPLPGISRNAKKKFRKYLRSLETVFASLAKRYPIRDRKGTDASVDAYHAEIRREFNDEAQFLRYIAGDWDDEILAVVSTVQKSHMVPQRPKPAIQQQPRATFKPNSQYQSYLNR
jgi:hypothetical protein